MRSEKINKIVLINLTILLLFAFAFNSKYSNYSITINDKLENSDNIDLESISISTSSSYTIFWKENGTILCNEETGQYFGNIISDENGGAIAGWGDSREPFTGVDLYAQKVDKTGNSYWGNGSMWGVTPDRNGTVICNALGQQVYMGDVTLCSDMMGGAIFAWRDKRAGGKGDIYAQRIDKDGINQWDDNGTVICNNTNTQNYVKICSDGANGAIITWVDYRVDADGDIYAQRIDKDGINQWDDNGTVICNNTNTQNNAIICSDGANGAIITWVDKRIDANGDIYAQHIDSNGDTQWGDSSTWGVTPDRNGTVICNATDLGPISDIDICSIVANGAIITWADTRIDANGDIYAQYIDSNGDTQWGDSTTWGLTSDRNGTAICNATGIQNMPFICYDGENSAIIMWLDNRGVTTDIYAQKINLNGITLWDDNGIVICNELSSQGEHDMCFDGYGGAIITWKDNRNPPSDIYVQQINKNGVTQFDNNGTLISNNNSQDSHPKVCSDSNGGAIVAWEDTDAVYAQRIGYSASSGILPAGDDDDDDDDDDMGFVVVVVVIIILASIGGVVVVIIVLIKKGIIDLSKQKR